MLFFGIVLAVAAILQGNAQAVLEGSNSVTLFSLSPQAVPLFGKKKAPETFHGYPILARMELTGDAKSELLGKLYTSIAEDALPARCFNPRHGIRARLGEDQVDLVICFECHQIQSYLNGKRGGGTTSKSAEKHFNEALSRK